MQLNKLLLFVTFLLFSAVSIAQFSDDCREIDRIAAADAAGYKVFLPGNPKLGDNYDLNYHRFELYIDPDTLYVKGSVTSFFTVSSSGLSQMDFELFSQLTVDSVIFRDTLRAFSQLPGDILSIQTGQYLPSGTFDSITVYYQGVPTQGMGFGSFIKDYHNGTPVIWTLSEPYGAKDWWPCKNSLSDKIDSVDMIVSTPSAYRCASNGLLTGEYTAGSDKVYHWKHRYPIASYLIALAVTNYAVYTDKVPLNGDTLDILNYIYPEDLATAQAGTPGLIPVMQLYDSLFTPYPFMKEKYGHAQFGWGGGMEHQTMTFIVSFGHELMAHELAHQWYGDMVTCGSWKDIWINEGFATYVTGLTAEFMFGGYWWPLWKQLRIQHITAQPDGSVYCYDTSSVSRIFDGRLSYEKGAMVLHMIRWKIGDAAFFAGMNNILTDTTLAHGFAKTPDIQHHFEATSGENLTDFFNDWIYSEGHPVYTILPVINPDSSVEITLHQIPSHTSVSFFELPVPLRFKNDQHDTLIILDHTFSGQSFLVNPGFIPDSVFFDPDRWLVAVLDTMIITYNVETQPAFSCIYPNPSNGSFTICLPFTDTGVITIFNASGSICYSCDFSGTQSRLELSETLKPGLYYLKISGKHNNLSSKFVVQ